MSANKQQCKWVRLGDYIEQIDERNSEGINYPFCGINKEKTFMPTAADTNQLDKSKYKLVTKGTFVFSGMQTGRDICIRIALSDKDNTILVSPAYTTFKIKDSSNLLPQYLFLQFTRFEMDRYGWFLSDASIRSNLDWERFCDILIPLPSLELQQELVDAYNGLKGLAEDNEALIKPLEKACQAFVVDCKSKYPEVSLGEYIIEKDEKNENKQVKLAQGVTVDLEFADPKRVADNIEGSKIVRTGDFAYNKVMKAAGTKMPIAYRKGPDCFVSSSYCVFRVTDSTKLLSEYLMLWLSRKEIHRYAGYRSTGTTRDIFAFEEMRKLRLPLPPLEVQQSIVNLYHCIEKAKQIASEARELQKTICPALLQKAIHS